MKTKIQSPNRATSLEHLQVLHYQGITSLVLAIPAKTSPIFGFAHIFARDATPESMIPFNNYSEVETSAKLALIRKKIKELKLQPKS